MRKYTNLANKLLGEYNPGDARTIYLVASGLKPAGELQLGNNPIRYQKTSTTLAEVGLESSVSTVDAEFTCKSKAEKNTMLQYARAHGFSFSLTSNYAADSLTINNFPVGLYFWGDMASVDSDEIIGSENTGQSNDLIGRFFGYPACCIANFEGCKSVERYHHSLLRRIKQNGIESVSHLVGIEHMPCSLNCLNTQYLKYSDFLRENAAQMYIDGLYSLDDRAING